MSQSGSNPSLTGCPEESRAAIQRFESGLPTSAGDDAVAVEEPLEIRLGRVVDGKLRLQPVSITMRTPGDDFELAAGFLFTEGILQSSAQVREILHCGKGKVPTNTLRVELVAGVDVDMKRLERNFYTTSSCGVCGKTSLEALATGAQRVAAPVDFTVDARLIDELPERLRSQQHAFRSTGGLHASALFSRTGELLGLREDVGRHNALDKLIGSRFLAGTLPANDTILFLSGRASFELLQKAVMAGIPVVCAVGAPSSLAIEAAREFGVTLLGFVRGNRFNVYAGQERLVHR
ncbi:MAG: formate dehydrogenase accessory sulfurtransferase FdhD [Steroidobacteraceae bacterium]